MFNLLYIQSNTFRPKHKEKAKKDSTIFMHYTTA